MRRILCEQCVIRGRSVVQDIPVAELQAFRTYATSTLYRRRQVVFHEGTQATGLYILCHGAVKLYQSDRFGRDHILGLLGSGAVLGEMPTGPDVCYAASAEARTDAQLCYLPRDGLSQLIHRYPAFGVRLIEALSAELGNARRRVRGLLEAVLDDEVAEALAEGCRFHSHAVSPRQTKTKLPNKVDARSRGHPTGLGTTPPPGGEPTKCRAGREAGAMQ